MNDTEIRCFLLAAECLNFSEAAQKMFVSQSAFSRNIAKLEYDMQVVLFIRDTKHTALTSAGILVYNKLKELADEFDKMLLEARNIDHGYTGSISIGFLEGQMLDYVMQETLLKFQEMCPNIRINMFRDGYQELVQGLFDRTYDFIVTLQRDAVCIDSLNWEPVCSMTSMLVIPQNHRLAGKQGLSLSDFAEESFILPDRLGFGSGIPEFREMCKSAGFEAKIIIAPDMRTQLLWVEAGRGICISNKNNIVCNSPVLRQIEVSGISISSKFALAWNKININAAMPKFVQYLREIRKKLKYD